MSGRAMLMRRVLLGALLLALAPGGGGRAALRDGPERPPPWGDRWEPPRPPEPPELRAPVDAAAFAADCNDDGTVRVVNDLEVRGGSGTLFADCRVEVADAATLSLIDVSLAGSYAFEMQSGAAGRLLVTDSYLTLFTRIGIGGHDGAAVAIRRSELSSMAGGAIEILLTGPGARIELSDSMMMSDGATSIDVSPRADGGRIEVRNSTLAAGSMAASALILAASLGGVAGEAVVRESHLIGTASIAIETGTQGRTEVRDCSIETAGEVRIAAGDGGQCEATGNDPDLICPPPAEGESTAVTTGVSGG